MCIFVVLTTTMQFRSVILITDLLETCAFCAQQRQSAFWGVSGAALLLLFIAHRGSLKANELLRLAYPGSITWYGPLRSRHEGRGRGYTPY